MRWITLIVVLLSATLVLTGCDRSLNAEEKASVPLPPPENTTVEVRDAAYWDALVFAQTPPTVEGEMLGDPFEPMIVPSPKTQPSPPASPSQARTVQPAPEVRWKVTGVIWGRVPMAILRVGDAQKLVSVGEQVERYRVKAIRPDQVVLQKQEHVRVLKFEDEGEQP